MPNNYDRVSLEISATNNVPISYSTISLFDNIAHKNQIEISRINIETIYLAEFGNNANLTSADKKKFSIIKPDWITYNETTKTITAIVIPANQSFVKEDGTSITYPQMTSSEPLNIRRRTINSELLVTWITGSRFTAEQLNLLAAQLIGIGQENLYEIENKTITIDDEDIIYASPEYVDNAVDGVVGLISLPGGISNATNYDKRLVVLSRIANENIPQAAASLLWDETPKTLKLIANSTQSNNRLEFLENDGSTLVNFFNQRGVLNSAGRIFYGTTQPNPNALDTGLLWWDTSGGNQALKVWDGTSWVSLPTAAGTYVTTNTSQTITGAKTFSAATIFNGAVTMNSPVTIGSGIALDYNTLSNTAKTITATLADSQIFTAPKIFNNHIVMSTGSTVFNNVPTITTSTGTTNAEGGSLTLRVNANAASRYIQLVRNDLTTDGVVISSLNPNGNGRTKLIGPTIIESGDLTLGTNSAIRNLNLSTRIPGYSCVFYKPSSSDTIYRPSNYDPPNSVISTSVNATTKLITFTIQNTSNTLSHAYIIAVRLSENPPNFSTGFNRYVIVTSNGSTLVNGLDASSKRMDLLPATNKNFTIGYTAQTPNFTLPAALLWANVEIEVFITVVY